MISSAGKRLIAKRYILLFCILLRRFIPQRCQYKIALFKLDALQYAVEVFVIHKLDR